MKPSSSSPDPLGPVWAVLFAWATFLLAGGAPLAPEVLVLAGVCWGITQFGGMDGGGDPPSPPGLSS
jgi:hypothetical protein